MRSRDGNSSIIHRFLYLIILSSLALHASEYLISYRYMVKDMTIYNEDLFISHAMHKCEGEIQTPIYLDIKNKETDLKKIIYNDFDRFTDFVYKLGLEIKHNDKTINYEHTSSTILTLRTTCFKVDINDNFAKIAPLK